MANTLAFVVIALFLVDKYMYSICALMQAIATKARLSATNARPGWSKWPSGQNGGSSFYMIISELSRRHLRLQRMIFSIRSLVGAPRSLAVISFLTFGSYIRVYGKDNTIYSS